MDGDEGVLSPATTPTNKGVAADDNPFVSGLARMGSLIARPFRTKDDSRRSSPGGGGAGVDGGSDGRESLGSDTESDDNFYGAANLRIGDEAALFTRTEAAPMDAAPKPRAPASRESDREVEGDPRPNPFLQRMGSLFGKIKRDTREMFSGGGDVEPSMEVLGSGGGDHPLAYQGYIDQALGR